MALIPRYPVSPDLQVWRYCYGQADRQYRDGLAHARAARPAFARYVYMYVITADPALRVSGYINAELLARARDNRGACPACSLLPNKPLLGCVFVTNCQVGRNGFGGFSVFQ